MKLNVCEHLGHEIYDIFGIQHKANKDHLRGVKILAISCCRIWTRREVQIRWKQLKTSYLRIELYKSSHPQNIIPDIGFYEIWDCVEEWILLQDDRIRKKKSDWTHLEFQKDRDLVKLP